MKKILKKFLVIVLLFSIGYIYLPSYIVYAENAGGGGGTDSTSETKIYIYKTVTKKDFDNSMYASSIRKVIADKLNIDYSKVSLNGTPTYKRGDTNVAFVATRKNGNDYAIYLDKSKADTVKNGTTNNIIVPYKLSDSSSGTASIFLSVDLVNENVCCLISSGKYATVSKNSCNSNRIQSDSSKCGGTTDTTDDVEACYERIDSNVSSYKWMKQSEAFASSNKYKITSNSSAGTDKKACAALNNGLQDTMVDTETGEVVNQTTSSSSYGKNSCTQFIVKRTRAYNNTNPTYNSIAVQGKNTKFNSPVGAYDYYYVYKTYYNCAGSDTQTPITAFCVDPGASGPTIEGIKYYSNSSNVVNKDSELWRGLYRLYSNWYVDSSNYQEIKSASGSGSTTAEDYADYVLNNVARRLVFDYGAAGGITTYVPGNADSVKLKNEYKLYKNTNGFPEGDSMLKKVYDDVISFINNKGEVLDAANEVEFKVEYDTPKLLDSNTGFEVEFTVKLKSDDESLIEEAKSNFTITAATEAGTQIQINDSDITTINEWASDSTGYMTAKFKVTKKNIYQSLGESDSVKLQINTSYVSKKSVENILVLTTPATNSTGVGSSKYQKFLIFNNGKNNKTEEINIDMGKKKGNVCKATYALPCTGSETVFYLIEGTQSGTLFNTVMSGINSIGDLRDLIGNATSMVEYLKTAGLNSLSLSNLKNSSSLLYNFADKVNITKNIKNELSFLNTLYVNNNNKTANLLMQAINNANFTNSAENNFKILSSLFINTLLNGLNNGFDTVQKEWKEIVEATKNSTISSDTKTLIENIGNAINSAGNISSLKDVLNASSSLTGYLAQATKIDQIMNNILSFSSTIQTVVSSTGDGLSGILEYMNTIKTQVFSASNLGSVSNLLESVTNAFTVDWEKCIIGENGVEATDPNGNSYTVQTANDYCKIVCKEDYAFKMPGNLGSTYSGRYLSVNLDNIYHATVGIAGQRTCVTTSIDNDKYLNDATDSKQKMLDAYNNYLDRYSSFREALVTKPTDEKVIADPTPIDTGRVLIDFKSQVNSSLAAIKKKIIIDTIGTSTGELYWQLQANFTNSMENFAVYIAYNFIGGDSIDSDTIIDAFKQSAETSFGDTYEEYKDKLNSSIDSVKDTVAEEVKKIAKTALKGVGSSALELIGKGFVTAACNVAKFFGADVCWVYADGTQMLKNAVTKLNDATQDNLNVFNIHGPSNYTYTTDIYKFADTSNNEKKLSSEFVKDTTKTISSQTKGDEIEIWIMESGSYILKSLHMGVYLNLSYFNKSLSSFKKALDVSTQSIGDIKVSLNSIKDATNIAKNPTIKKIKKMSSSSFSNNINNFNNVLSTLNSMFSIVSQTKEMGNLLEKDVSDILDYALDGYYYLRGAFNPYYASLAKLREEMRNYKEEYENYRTNLQIKARNMNACTIWEQEYQMDPEITFTYGYKNNNLLEFMASKKDKTTNSIKLRAMNKESEPTVSTYYCYKDVDINKIQDWNNIMDGTCVTSDGILGSIAAALIGEGNSSGVAQAFADSKAGLNTLLSNVKDIPFVSDFISSLGISSDEEDVSGSVVTYIPGSITYDLTKAKNVFKDVSTAFSSKDFEKFEHSIVLNLIAHVQEGTTVKYRNVKRVATISRYGNPGVAISGFNLQSLLSNIGTWVSNKFGGSSSDFLSKVNDIASSINGQGSQQFVYYKSSQPYWTYSNKGIYVTNPSNISSSEQPVLIDSGDTALTNPDIVTIDGSEKQAEGLVYPIALSTSAGTYGYQIEINNVGQYYNNTYALGRIVDNNGYVSGLLANQYVCKYEVKSEPDTKNPTCQDIYDSSDCKSDQGYFKDLYKANFANTNGITYESEWNACIDKLLAQGKECCNYIDNGTIPSASQEKYNSVCNTQCKGVKLYGSDGIISNNDGNGNNPNTALINKNGVLQFYTKVVSNYDLFPNGGSSKGYNWSGQTSGYENTDESGNPQPKDLDKIIADMEERGDNSYTDEFLEYSINLNSACMSKIKAYNDQQEINDLGFGDYTGGIENKQTREYRSQFLKDLEESSEYAVCRQTPITNQLQK